MSEYDFSGFITNPPPGMKVQKADKEYLWVKRTRMDVHRAYTDEFVVVKKDGKFIVYRLGRYDIKCRPEYWMNKDHEIFASNSLLPALALLGYTVR